MFMKENDCFFFVLLIIFQEIKKRSSQIGSYNCNSTREAGKIQDFMRFELLPSNIAVRCFKHDHFELSNNERERGFSFLIKLSINIRHPKEDNSVHNQMLASECLIIMLIN